MTVDGRKDQNHFMFLTVLHQLKSPENVGMIVRSHVAFGGDKVILSGKICLGDLKKYPDFFP
ncbi:MAG: TrmH family RNA methyltransferase [Nitrospinota bacterium]|nr:TrmH family RNA methyltransferase [Nitrospinota bacterium]